MGTVPPSLSLALPSPLCPFFVWLHPPPSWGAEPVPACSTAHTVPYVPLPLLAPAPSTSAPKRTRGLGTTSSAFIHQWMRLVPLLLLLGWWDGVVPSPGAGSLLLGGGAPLCAPHGWDPAAASPPAAPGPRCSPSGLSRAAVPNATPPSGLI